MSEYISAGKFKAECLGLMDQVKKSGKSFIIMKRKIPIAKLSPLEENSESLFGLLKEEIKIKDDLLAPIDEEWDATYS
jgi:antitoxin (DNA-binding transcriptional repressor) of toxin-antitoxin stability system